MSRLEKCFQNNKLREAILKQLKEISLHVNTAILCMVEGHYDDAYSEVFLVKALSTSLWWLLDRIEKYGRDEEQCQTE